MTHYYRLKSLSFITIDQPFRSFRIIPKGNPLLKQDTIFKANASTSVDTITEEANP